tara:strand:+ start:3626 stop:3991 length:366 start_codon:yes stop_codon:yes gene_type:complete
MNKYIDKAYKSKEEFESEKAEFMSYYYYIKTTDPDGYKDWFDKEVLDLFINGKRNPYFSAQRVRPGNENVSMVRVPTRCPKCKRAWAIENHKANLFEPHFLDQSVYKTIPLIKGECHECKD